MTTWEIDVELRVRKTLCFAGPTNEDAARTIANAFLQPGFVGLETIMKYGGSATRPVPVETVIDNDPQIVAVRCVEGAAS